MPGEGDLCAHHRGNSPSTPRRSLRKSSSDQMKKNSSPNNSRKKSWERKRKLSIFSEPKTQIFPAERKQSSEFKIKPSSRTRKLYRFSRTFSEGFSESDQEDDWMGKLKKSSKKTPKEMLSKRKISELAKYLKFSKMSEASIPKVVVQDFSKKPAPRLNKMKLKAFTAFLEGQSGNKIVDISEEPIDNDESKIKDGSDGLLSKDRKLNRSKLLAITSFTKLGKKEVDFVEIESDYDQEYQENISETNIIATEEEAEERPIINESMEITSESDRKATNTKPDNATSERLDRQDSLRENSQTLISKNEAKVEESLTEENSNENAQLQIENSKINSEETVIKGEEKNKIQQKDAASALTKGPLNPPEPFSKSEFDKSRNSKTAAMFQKHGKLLEDDNTASVKKRDTKKLNIFSCCLYCCKKEKS